MKRNIINIVYLLAFASVICSCSTEKMETPSVKFDMNLTARIPWMYEQETKAALYNDTSEILSMPLKLYGWENDTKWIDGEDVTYSSGCWTMTGTYKLDNKNSYSFLSYANMPSAGATITAPSTKEGSLTYSVTDITKAQNDVLLGRGSVSTPTDGDVDINYSHPYASVVFKIGSSPDIEEVKAISISGIYKSGKTTISQTSTVDGNGVMQYSWTDKGSADGTLEVSGLTKKEGDSITTFVVIPQELTTNSAVVTLIYDGGKTMIKTLNEGSWTAGYTTTYTLTRTGTVEITIPTGTKTITNNGTNKIYVRASITGAWYDASGSVVAPWSLSDGTFTGLPGADWTGADGIYYYKNFLENGKSTSALYSDYTKPSPAPVAGATLKLDITFQAIPYDVNKTCQKAFEALSE